MVTAAGSLLVDPACVEQAVSTIVVQAKRQHPNRVLGTVGYSRSLRPTLSSFLPNSCQELSKIRT